MRIERDQTIALAIDFQEKLIPAIKDHEALMERVEILLKGLKVLNVPTVITQHYTKGLGMSPQNIFDVVGTNEYQDKITFSAYDVAEPLIRGKRYVLICGMEAHCCVLQTLIDVAAAGYVPVLVTDCIGSRKDRDLQMAITRARQEGAVITTYEAILFELLKEAGTPDCKEILKLVK